MGCIADVARDDARAAGIGGFTMNALHVTWNTIHPRDDLVAAPSGQARAVRSGRPRWVVPVVMAMAAAVSGACGGGADPGATATDPSTTPPAPTTSAASPSPTLTTPGQLGEPGFPYPADSALSVVGVAHDDVLNVRSGPGTSFPVVATLGPVADDVTATGRVWQSESSWWTEVSPSGTTGWVNTRLVAGRDGTQDVTSQVITKLGSRPVATSMVDLGRTVASSRAPGPEEASIVMSVAPSVGDLGEVSYDVVGLSDDSVKAQRLHVFGQPTGSGGFSLKSVEATSFCARGAPPSGGLCP